MDQTLTTPEARRARARPRGVAYHVVATVIFAAYLLVELVRRLFPTGAPSTAAAPSRSVVADARSIAHTAAGYAFKR